MTRALPTLLCLLTTFLAAIAGAQAGEGPVAAVPEPTTLSLIGLVAVGCAAGYKLRKRKGPRD